MTSQLIKVSAISQYFLVPNTQSLEMFDLKNVVFVEEIFEKQSSTFSFLPQLHMCIPFFTIFV